MRVEDAMRPGIKAATLVALAATSPVKTGGQAATALSVDVSGRTTLRLAVGNGGDDIDYDHADWANARVTCQQQGP